MKLLKAKLMKLQNIANFNNIDEYVSYKSNKLREGECSFKALFDLMFSEKENVMWETNNGYRIISTTYGQVYEEIIKRANSLKEKLAHFNQGSIVGLYMQNSLDWIEMFWAILNCGFRPLLMNTRMAMSDLNAVVVQNNVVAVISDGAEFEVKTINEKEIVQIDKAFEDVLFGDEILIMSSGTSSNVKICAYGPTQIKEQILNAEKIVKQSRLVKKHYNGQLKQLTFLPFYHIFGLAAMYMWFAFYARSFVYLKDMSPQCILNTIRRHEVTHVFAVPLFWDKVYEQAIKKIKERGEKTVKKLQKGLKISNALSCMPALARFFRKKAFKEVRENMFGESICFLISGGGAIKNEVLSFFNGIGYHLSNGYGMSEIGITSVELSEDNRVLNSASIGKPMPSVEYAINENNELLVKGTSLCKYYTVDGKVVEIKDEWFNTKDLAKFENGNYYLLGRTDDLIVSTSGENLNPNLIEDKLYVDNAKKICLIGTGDIANAHPVLLVQVNRHLSTQKKTALVNDIKEKLKALDLVSEIKEIALVVEDLIKDNEFKLNRKRLASDFANGKLQIAIDKEDRKEDETLDELENQVMECFKKVLNKPITKTSDFFLDAEGTSLDYFTLISYLQDEFEVIIPLSNNKKMTTVVDFCEYLKENI